MEFSRKALDLILSFEGDDQPGRWPGASSGITLPKGYDLGYKALSEFRADWGRYLSQDVMKRLEEAVGVKGQAAKALAYKFKDIRVDPKLGERVFFEATLPKFVELTRKTFPGFDDLPLDAQGAIVSVVFNRGASTKGSSRVEMAEIKEILSDGVDSGDLLEIAKAIRSMKRLWEGKGLRGLLRRRDAEANLVESCITRPGRAADNSCAEGGKP